MCTLYIYKYTYVLRTYMHMYVYNVFWCCYLAKLSPKAGVKRSRAASNSGMYVYACYCYMSLDLQQPFQITQELKFIA